MLLLATPPATPRRERLARLERPLLLAGLALVALHLLDLAFSGAATSLLAILGIVALPAAWAALQPRMIRPTRIALAVPVGLLAVGFGVTSHGLHAVHLGPDRYDITGLLFIGGGLALLASAVVAAAAPRGPRRSLGAKPGTWVPSGGLWGLRAIVWAGGAVAGLILLIPIGGTALLTHAPRWPIHERTLGVPHEEVRIPAGGGRELAAWWIPSRNGVAALLVHGSGGSRARVAAHARMLARHGYGVLALDLPGNGESDGHSNGLGDNAQPAITTALDYLQARPGVDRMVGYGVSMGGEVLLEAAARDTRLRAVVSDGSARPEDADKALPPHGMERVVRGVMAPASRALAGTRAAPSLTPLMSRIAPRPVLLVATTGDPAEIPTNRVYARAGGPTTELWELHGVGHVAGVRRRPAAYEAHTIGFLDRALGLRPR
jgi:pimeloyl-ACP methyl ester carboxylesterase